jgi:hypothetical protein
MAWTAYRIVYQAKSPIHIGWHTLGYINLTRYYMPGKTMWGAFAANMARTWGRPGTDGYAEWGEFFRKEALLSYFYPATDAARPLLPVYDDEGLRYAPSDNPKGGLTEYDFEKLFINSYMQTAIRPESNAAEDESLHESEYIAPVIETENGTEVVYFIGYLFLKDGACYGEKVVGWDHGDVHIKTAVSEIFVGAERTSGWGRLALDRRQVKEKPTDFFGHVLDLRAQADGPTATILSGKPIPAHVPVITGLSIKGDFEALVGRAWNDRGPGQQVEMPANALYWMPGSILLEPEAARSTFQVGPYGILNLRGVNVSKSS